MRSTTQPVPGTRHLDVPVPRYLRHADFSHRTAPTRLDPHELLTAPFAEGTAHMPDEVTREHAKRMHYAAHRMHRAKNRRELRAWQQSYLDLRNRVVVGNRKLVYRAVRSFTNCRQQAEELAGEGHITLIRVVATFNPWVGIRFSTYAYTCLLREMSRIGRRAIKDVTGGAVPLGNFPGGEPPCPRELATAPAYSWFEVYFRADHALLSEREKNVIRMRFNLNGQSDTPTLAQVGAEVGLSKERVRQVQAAAITKLQQALGFYDPESRRE